MKSQQSGFAHAVLVIVLVVALIGALGFIFWQNFIDKEDSTQKEVTTTETQTDDTKKVLAIKEFGKSLDLSNAPYSDITYAMTSVNSDDANKYVAAIYSKDLNARLVEDAKKSSPSIDYTSTYWKLGANRAVYAYYYNPSKDSTYPDMIDGVARNIIDPSTKSSTSKLYVGFMGPGSASSSSLNEENATLLNWVKTNLN